MIALFQSLRRRTRILWRRTFVRHSHEKASITTALSPARHHAASHSSTMTAWGATLPGRSPGRPLARRLLTVTRSGDVAATIPIRGWLLPRADSRAVTSSWTARARLYIGELVPLSSDQEGRVEPASGADSESRSFAVAGPIQRIPLLRILGRLQARPLPRLSVPHRASQHNATVMVDSLRRGAVSLEDNRSASQTSRVETSTGRQGVE